MLYFKLQKHLPEKFTLTLVEMQLLPDKNVIFQRRNSLLRMDKINLWKKRICELQDPYRQTHFFGVPLEKQFVSQR